MVLLVAAFLDRSVADDRPDIVLILADDLGYSDLGCYGGEIETPNLDRLAEGGMKFARFYNAGRCCPTRASLLTGVFPHQAGIGHMTYDAGEPGYRGNLNPDTATIAEVLKSAGYRTGMFGKWHLTPNTSPDADRSNWPRQRGFDRFYGTLPGYGSLWNPAGLYDDNEPIQAGDDFFYTDTITDKAIEFVTVKSGEPFFLYLAFTAPHYPLHARPETIAGYDGIYDKGWDLLREERFKRLKTLGLMPESAQLPPRDEGSIPWEGDPNQAWQAQRMQTFAAMVDEMDQAIGRLLEVLDENTLVVFLSDNGGSPEGHLNNTIERMKKEWVSSLIPEAARDGSPMISGDVPGVDLGPENTFGSYGLRWASLSNTPFRRHKAWMHEGGICTPCIVNWPGFKQRGSTTQEIGHIVDLMPTFLELAGAEPPKQAMSLQGESLLGVIMGEKLDRNVLAWEHEGNRAIRQGRWKLVSEFPGTWTYFYPYEKEGEWELYDFETDPTELIDLAKQYPDKVTSMIREYEQWARDCLVIEWEKLEGRKE